MILLINLIKWINIMKNIKSNTPKIIITALLLSVMCPSLAYTNQEFQEYKRECVGGGGTVGIHGDGSLGCHHGIAAPKFNLDKPKSELKGFNVSSLVIFYHT